MSDAVARLNAALEGRYAIERELGEGGMATVYLADDLKHERKVALKVLKPELAAVVGAERFLAEIKTTAGLQHPHILPLHDSGEADGFLFYVMPYVEGETLRDRIDREKQLPVDEAVALASKVAGALHHAHEHGVIHRDIKPGNILIQGGEPVVADFGIALAAGAAGSSRLTETGLSLGTPYYMSPEQATGDQAVGASTDTYALGSVLYEMLVGEPPYPGTTAQAVLGRIIAGKPISPTEQRPSIPANVDAALRKALEKLPADRFTSAQEFVRALADPGFRHGEVVGVASGVGPWNRLTVATTALASLSVLVAAWGWLRPAAPPATFDVGVSDTVPLATNGEFRAFTVSPTGDFLIYVAQKDATTELWYRSLTGDEAHPVPGTVGALGTPIILPDGAQVLFTLDGELKLTPIAGGSSSTVAGVGRTYFDLGAGEGVVFIDQDGLRFQRLDLLSGDIVEEIPVTYCINPHRLPGGRRLLCGGGTLKFAYVVDLEDSALDSMLAYTPLRTTAVPGADRARSVVRGSDFRIVDDEYLLYMSLEGDLRAVPIDVADDRVGRSITVLPGVRTESYSGIGQYQVTPDGTLYYIPGIHAHIGRLVRTNADGVITPLPIDPAPFVRFDLSPDGRSLAAVVEGIERQELRIYNLQTGGSQVWLEEQLVLQPRWSPDDDPLLVGVRAVPGVTGAVLLGSPNSPSPPDTVAWISNFWAGDYHADSLILGALGRLGRTLRLDVSTLPATVDFVGGSSFMESISPDGRWLTHWGTDFRGFVLEPWPSRDRVYEITGAGYQGLWLSANEIVSGGLEIGAGRREGRWYKTRIDPDSDPPFRQPVFWFQDPLFTDVPGPPFTTTHDGGILYMQRLGPNVAHFIRVIPGWVEQMKRAVDEANR
jgi:serine/threonine-protein kinase